MVLSNKTKLRFVNDHNLPIQVVEEPYFNYFLDLYEPYNQARTKYQKLVLTIELCFDGDEEKFLSEYYTVRDKVIDTILTKDTYLSFNKLDMNQFKVKDIGISAKTNIYNQENIGKKFISIDLKKANFQALKYINRAIFNNVDSYEEFISGFTDIGYFKESKYTRQVIFGQLNPSRTVTIEKFLTYKIYDLLTEICFIEEGAIVRSITNDEIILEIDNDISIEILESIEDTVKEKLNLDVRVESFQLLQAADTPYFIKCDLNHIEKYQIMCVPVNLFAQVYKKVTSQEIDEDMDLIFYNDKMLAKYLKKI